VEGEALSDEHLHQRLDDAQPALITDIYQDDRIPHDAYRPTFVKSLAMVPIRTKDPIGAIGTYWATTHETTLQELELLRALADSTSIAIENVQMYETLEQKVKERTAELEAFSYSVSHDLRAPLRGIAGFAQILKEDFSQDLDPEALRCVNKITSSAARMADLMEGLVTLSRLGRFEMEMKEIDISKLAQQVFEDVRLEDQNRKIDFKVVDINEHVHGDPSMLRALLENLLRNAWKFTRHQPMAMVEFGLEKGPRGEKILYVKDNGAGFDMNHAQKLFKPFQRLHSDAEFEGNGIGLATVQKIVSRHGGRIWAEGKENHGAKISFTLPA
jgi:light-regulated signal transduction histidine kinase (bacteriophytochrome)